MRGKIYRRAVKPLVDRAAAAAALVALAPVFGGLCLAIRLRMGSPVFFRQVRIGRGDRAFRILKFRTMTDARDRSGALLPDAERLTGVGRFIRETSLDELPQLWNVLRGEMSLIGPRPLLPEYLPRYSAFQRRRHEVTPGITGLAQVSGRNGLAWERKFELDVEYVERCSFGMDLKILWMTVVAVARRSGIREEGQATASPFAGSAKE